MPAADAEPGPQPPAELGKNLTPAAIRLTSEMSATVPSVATPTGSACARIVSGLRRAGYSETVATEQARKFAERVAELDYRRTLAAVAEAVR